MLGDLFIANEYNEDGEPTAWLDCYQQWGVGLDGDEAYEALMTFRPNKEIVTNKNVTVHGSAYVTGAGYIDARTVSVPFHIVAMNKADFLLKRAAFYRAIQGGMITLKIVRPVECTYKLYYESCNQYTQFLSGMAKFILVFSETNGSDDADFALPEPMPMYDDMQQYIYDLLKTYGGLATEAQVRAIITNYRPINTNGNFA